MKFNLRGIYGIVFCTGIAGLVYQVVWIRQLMTVTSAMVTAQSSVLAVFMAGLGFGSLIAGNKAWKSRNPLISFIFVELGALIFSIGMLPLLRYGIPHIPVSEGMSLFFLPSYWVRLFLISLYLFIPTTFLGMSLPFLMEFADRIDALSHKEGMAKHVGIIYGINTIGAAFGTFLAGYITIEYWGLTKSLIVGGIFAFTGIIFACRIQWKYFNSFRLNFIRTKDSAKGSGEKIPVTFLILVLISGFIGLGAEVLWTRMISLIVLNTVYAYTQVLAAVLLGIALGGLLSSFLIGRASKEPQNDAYFNSPIYLLFILAALLILFIPVLLIFFAQSSHFYLLLAQGNSISALVFLFILIVPPSTLIATIFPLIAASRTFKKRSFSFGLLYTFNTLGGIIGSITVGFILIPLLGTQLSTIILSSLCIISAVLYCLKWKRPYFVYVPFILIVVLGIAQYRYFEFPRVLYEKIVSKDTVIREIYEGVGSHVMVTDEPDGQRKLWLNSSWVAGTGGRHYLLGHLPALFIENPQNILGIALGTGQTFSSIFKHGVKRFDCAEINAGVISLSRKWFNPFTNGFLDKPNVVVHHVDGREFLRSHKGKFDLIVLEPLQAWSVGTTSLYTAEFYEEAKRSLKKDGILAQWLPFYGQGVFETQSMAKTAVTSFPNASLWLTGQDGILLLQNEKVSISPKLLFTRIAERNIRKHLRSVNLGTSQDLFSLFLVGSEGIRKWTDQATLITDDLPFLEFTAARSVGTISFHEILSSIKPHLENIFSYTNEQSKENRAICNRAMQIRNTLFSITIPSLEYTDKIAILDKNLKIFPDSELLRATFRHQVLLYATFLMRSATERTVLVKLYEHALETDQEFSEAAMNLAEIYANQGDFSKAIHLVESISGVERTAVQSDKMLHWLKLKNNNQKEFLSTE